MNEMDSIAQKALEKILDGKDLSFQESTSLMDSIAGGKVSSLKIAALLSSLACKGESSDELAGFANSLRKNAVQLEYPENTAAPKNTADIVGTGGDKKGYFNISTAAAITAAAANLMVMKHGNRSVTSQTGSADVLEALGVNIQGISGQNAANILLKIGMTFLFSPNFHPAMKHVAPVRKDLGIATLFNLIGPLSNPANPEYMLIGVSHKNSIHRLARALRKLPLISAMVVSAEDGSDEITLHCPTHVTEWRANDDDDFKSYAIQPKALGLFSSDTAALQVANKEESATIILEILAKKRKDACLDIVLLNAAALLYLASKAQSIEAGLSLAEKAVNSGAAMEKLQKFILASKNL